MREEIVNENNLCGMETRIAIREIMRRERVGFDQAFRLVLSSRMAGPEQSYQEPRDIFFRSRKFKRDRVNA